MTSYARSVSSRTSIGPGRLVVELHFDQSGRRAAARRQRIAILPAADQFGALRQADMEMIELGPETADRQRRVAVDAPPVDPHQHRAGGLEGRRKPSDRLIRFAPSQPAIASHAEQRNIAAGGRPFGRHDLGRGAAPGEAVAMAPAAGTRTVSFDAAARGRFNSSRLSSAVVIERGQDIERQLDARYGRRRGSSKRSRRPPGPDCKNSSPAPLYSAGPRNTHLFNRSGTRTQSVPFSSTLNTTANSTRSPRAVPVSVICCRLILRRRLGPVQLFLQPVEADEIFVAEPRTGTSRPSLSRT